MDILKQFIIWILPILVLGSGEKSVEMKESKIDFDKSVYDLPVSISNSDENILELLTDVYTDEQLQYMDDLELDLKEMNDEFQIQCIRENEAGYRVIYRSDKSVLIVCFEKDFEKYYSRIFPMAKTKSDFDMVKVGQTVEEVMEFDEDGDYGFLYAGNTSDIPYESEHYTMDGHLITISYKVHENSYIVIDVHSELI